ncbi:ADP-ribosyl cyclase/cyclic ADP-ribose hydrolase [Citrus sinensis]|uniref:ADP-ribosyl cyclase/cyclic ADP-ribose hydrolase n=1 Tax=Citrus sinensis TaxID=2711 RepID=A0ACB8HY01_CITSI|nr:ADP-ribosyl cyclase/cyclic ADP-ribose hydrolase [Citrus sinensis]
MASSSSSINMIPHPKHDVFLSFRGKDVRHNFVSHLNAALCREKIETFIDDKLNRGNEISPSLSSAIEGSKISIVIFSEGSESVLIEGNVNDISKKLSDLFPSDNKDQLVGVESIIKEIESQLLSGSTEFNTVGIWGIGGIGKTTIASAIYSNISSHFEGSYFMQNIRDESEKVGGLANIHLNFERRRLSRMKVLIVFYDLTDLKQIDLLIGRLDGFVPGSRVIITTRDVQLLKNHRGSRVGHVFEVKELSYNDSLTLFSRNAFGQNHPAAGFLELSNIVIKYANGVPLALQVLGSYLKGMSEEEWESAVNKLKRMPHMDIQKVLKVSYDGLDDEEQNIFLDTACFFKGNDQYLVMNFLDACRFSAKIGISRLVGKSLVTISNNKITMHDLLQEMGGEIVRQESIKDPGKRSRLWHPEDIYQVLNENTNLAVLKRLNLSYSKQLFEIPDLSLALNLEQLNLEGCTSLFEIHSSIQHLNKLVILNLGLCTSLKSLPTGINLDSLKELYLGGCSNLKRFPEISCNIEDLDLKETAIEELPSSIGNLSRLVDLDLTNCSGLKSVSSRLCNLKSLRRLNLSGCLKLEKLPEEIGNLESLEYLNLAEKDFEKIPSSMKQLSKLSDLRLQNCKRLQSLPELPCGSSIHARHCTSLKTLSNSSTLLTQWLSFQSMGSSVTLELPPGWFNKNFVGFALCAIVPEYHGYTLELYVECNLKTKDGDGDVTICFPSNLWEDDFKDDSSILSDHVLLGYDFSWSSYYIVSVVPITSSSRREVAFVGRTCASRFERGLIVWVVISSNRTRTGLQLPVGQDYKKNPALDDSPSKESGLWASQTVDGARALGCESDDNTTGFKNKNINNPQEDGMWIMHEFTVNSSILEDYSDKAVHYAESQFRLSAHGSSAHGLSAHGLSAHGSSAHGSSAHGLSAHRSSAHEFSAHGSSAHGLSAHGLSAHRTSAHRKSAYGAN